MRSFLVAKSALIEAIDEAEFLEKPTGAMREALEELLRIEKMTLEGRMVLQGFLQERKEEHITD